MSDLFEMECVDLSESFEMEFIDLSDSVEMEVIELDDSFGMNEPVENEAMELDSSYIVIEETTLEDLPTEILDKIMRELYFVDLVKMYDINKRFRAISNRVIFDKQCSQDLISVSFNNFNESDSIMATALDGKVINLCVMGFKNIKRFVRLFHSHIEQLDIDFSTASEDEQREIFWLVVHYCHKFLERIKISYLFSYLDFISEACLFSKVKFLELDSCVIKGSLAYLPKFFPNVEEMNLVGNCDVEDEEMGGIINSYARLQYLKISPNVMDMEWFELLCRWNPLVFSIYREY